MKTADGLLLQVRTWKTTQVPRAELLFLHGMGEHGGRYAYLAERLTELGFTCHALDLRGHGRSPGPRGDIRAYPLLLDDLEGYYRSIKERSDLPVFFYGHSTGGQLLINLLTQRPVTAHAVVISSPWLALTFRPHPVKVMLSNLLRRVWPSFTLESGTGPEMMSSDLDHLRSMPELELTHKRMSARMFHELLDGAATARAAAAKFIIPLLLMHGEADPITSCEASRTFFAAAASADKTLRLYPGMRHEPHNEPERETGPREVQQWLLQHLPR
ncbi:MAG: alpha/beta hydrolase [Chthoniobacteraceae bacterium]